MGTLLFTLLLMSDGMAVRKEPTECTNCGDNDDLEVGLI